MKLKVKAAVVMSGDGCIEDLEAALDHIKERQQFVREKLEMVRVGGHPKWPKEPERLRRKAIVARERLEADHEYLLDYSERFLERCMDDISIMMNDAMFR